VCEHLSTGAREAYRIGMNPISEILPMKISSVGELIACVHDMISADNEIRWFRGHASASWNVEPHIWRPETVGDERYNQPLDQQSRRMGKY